MIHIYVIITSMSLAFTALLVAHENYMTEWYYMKLKERIVGERVKRSRNSNIMLFIIILSLITIMVDCVILINIL